MGLTVKGGLCAQFFPRLEAGRLRPRNRGEDSVSPNPGREDKGPPLPGLAELL